MPTMWILRCFDDAHERTLRLAVGAIKTVGRGPRADFAVDATLLSRVHCRLTATSDDLVVEDLESTNGTFVNDRRVTRAALADGDRVRLGRLVFAVSKEAGASRPASGKHLHDPLD